MKIINNIIIMFLSAYIINYLLLWALFQLFSHVNCSIVDIMSIDK